jgi:hypothetical protein
VSARSPGGWNPGWSAGKRPLNAAENKTAGYNQRSALLKASEEQTLNLFLASKSPPERPGRLSCMTMASAESLPDATGKDKLQGKDYLAHFRRGRGAGVWGVNFPTAV